MTSLFEVLEWVKREGEAHALSRLRLRVLATTIREGIALTEEKPQTKCSRECLDTVLKAAGDIVGRPYPGER